ncbi:hypothetical protein C8R45DRAFT_938610 [Mycena sanguinolenta]|nr:hypothetical protein C8R45DRAFT_938610 [Mycena sanguinolenta]
MPSAPIPWRSGARGQLSEIKVESSLTRSRLGRDARSLQQIREDRQTRGDLERMRTDSATGITFPLLFPVSSTLAVPSVLPSNPLDLPESDTSLTPSPPSFRCGTTLCAAMLLDLNLSVGLLAEIEAQILGCIVS